LSIDPFCLFTVTTLSNGELLLCADDGMFLSRINRGNIDPIEAAKQEIDVFCQIQISITMTK
jgi:hypothetical protein